MGPRSWGVLVLPLVELLAGFLVFKVLISSELSELKSAVDTKTFIKNSITKSDDSSSLVFTSQHKLYISAQWDVPFKPSHVRARASFLLNVLLCTGLVLVFVLGCLGVSSGLSGHMVPVPCCRFNWSFPGGLAVDRQRDNIQWWSGATITTRFYFHYFIHTILPYSVYSTFRSCVLKLSTWVSSPPLTLFRPAVSLQYFLF